MKYMLSLLAASSLASSIPVLHDIHLNEGPILQMGEEIVGISPLLYFGSIVLVVVVALILDVVFIIKACNRI